MLEELAQLRDRVSKIEGVCDHCAVVQANESSIIKAVRSDNRNEMRTLITFVAKNWKFILTSLGFIMLWFKSQGQGVNADQIKRLQEAVDTLQTFW
ncbi:MAG: hypothetical protein ACOYD4_04000 [Solirubrobacterales bacterium]